MYLCYLMKDRKEVRPEDIPAVKEFLYVFLEKIPGLTPKREIDFEIELEPGAHLISKSPCKMALIELNELKVQLEDLLKKVIQDQVHPHGERQYCL